MTCHGCNKCASPCPFLVLRLIADTTTSSLCPLSCITTYEPFWDISLPISKDAIAKKGGLGAWFASGDLTLEDCLRAFTADETLAVRRPPHPPWLSQGWGMLCWGALSRPGHGCRRCGSSEQRKTVIGCILCLA